MSPTPTPTQEIAPYVQSSDLLDLLSQRQEGLSAAELLKAMPCATPEQEQFFADALVRVRLLIASGEEKRTTITKPLLEAKRQIDALFKPAREPWEQVESVIRQKLQAAQQRRLDEANRARAEAVRLAQLPDVAPQAVTAALAQVPEKFVPAGVGTGAEWEADLADISQVPREWLTVDWSKVKIHAREHAKSEHIPAVPGIVFRRVAKVRAR